MLRDDPIVSKYPQYLPSEDEVRLTWNLLKEPRHRELREVAERTIAICDCLWSSLWRFCWQAKQQDKSGQQCAQGAVEWIQRCISSRQRLQLDTVLIANPFPKDFCDLYISTIPFSIHGFDRYGHPVYITRYGLVDTVAFEQLWSKGEMLQRSSGLPVNATVLFHIRMMEYITKVAMREEMQRRGCVVDRLLAIMDLGGLGLKHVQQPSLKKFLRSVSSECVPVFPETLFSTIVANVPWLVSRAVWPLARQMMHPVTQAKFSVLASEKELLNTLCGLMGQENIPPYFGGRCACAECSQGRLRGGSMWLWEKGIPSDASINDEQPNHTLRELEPWDLQEDYLVAPSKQVTQSMEISFEHKFLDHTGLPGDLPSDDSIADEAWFPASKAKSVICPSWKRCCCPRNPQGHCRTPQRPAFLEAYSPEHYASAQIKRPPFLPPMASAQIARPQFLPPRLQSSSLGATLKATLAMARCWYIPFVVCISAFLLSHMLMAGSGASVQKTREFGKY